MNEVICAMRIIKMYTWEDSFNELVGKVRKYVKFRYSSDLSYFVLFYVYWG
jgi:hypothetical protein